MWEALIIMIVILILFVVISQRSIKKEYKKENLIIEKMIMCLKEHNFNNDYFREELDKLNKTNKI